MSLTNSIPVSHVLQILGNQPLTNPSFAHLHPTNLFRMRNSGTNWPDLGGAEGPPDDVDGAAAKDKDHAEFKDQRSVTSGSCSSRFLSAVRTLRLKRLVVNLTIIADIR